jgi:putative membrane protein
LVQPRLGVGVRNDSQLANDRTFLAWLRTGIALFGFGFVVAKVALIVDPGNGGVSDEALYAGVGVLMVLSGAALVAFGCVQHTKVARALDPEDLAPARWPRTIAAVAVVGSLALSVLIVVTT